MVWTQDYYDALVLKAKTVLVDLGLLVARDCKLGRSSNTNLDLLLYASNLLNALKYGVLIFQDDHYDYINEQVQILYNRCRKYRTV